MAPAGVSEGRMNYALRMTESQHRELYAHLFPGDGKEAVSLLLCGRREGANRHVLTVRKVVPIPHGVCDRREDRVTWPTEFIDPLLGEAYGRGLAIVKVHCHGIDYRSFSQTDDTSDKMLFSAVTSLLDDALPHASLIMLPDGELFGRMIGEAGSFIGSVSSIMVVGHDIRIWTDRRRAQSSFSLRHAQAFGCGTTEILRSLSVAVIGCSGTGSIVVEQLARLGVGRLVLVDPDIVEEKNLNRILNSGKEDAYLGRPKVQVLASAIARMGLDQEVLPLRSNLALSPEAVKAVGECDIAFGCMDGVEGRHLLNRLTTFYLMPYFDVGVRLDADGNGGIERIAGAVHYLQPGQSSLLSREVYSMARVEAEEMRRTDPEMYRRLVREGYLRGVDEDRPAVISVNMLLAALVVNEFLARLHVYRNQPNESFAYLGVNLSEMQFYPETEGKLCQLLARHVGRGDVVPLLERVSLS
jgi:hypothetical protein